MCGINMCAMIDELWVNSSETITSNVNAFEQHQQHRYHLWLTPIDCKSNSQSKRHLNPIWVVQSFSTNILHQVSKVCLLFVNRMESEQIQRDIENICYDWTQKQLFDACVNVTFLHNLHAFRIWQPTVPFEWDLIWIWRGAWGCWILEMIISAFLAVSILFIQLVQSSTTNFTLCICLKLLE